MENMKMSRPSSKPSSKPLSKIDVFHESKLSTKIDVLHKVNDILNTTHPSRDAGEELEAAGKALMDIGSALKGRTVVECRAIIKAAALLRGIELL